MSFTCNASSALHKKKVILKGVISRFHFTFIYNFSVTQNCRTAKLTAIFFLLAVQLLICQSTFSQSCANYAVTRTSGIPYTTIAGTGTSNFIWRNTASNQNDDNRSYPVSIGFDFWYLGVRYTSISAQLNGAVDFSASTADGNCGCGDEGDPNYFGSFSGGTAPGNWSALAPIFDDLWTAGGGTTAIAASLVYKLSGTAPNRVLTVEWINFDEWNSPANAPPASLNFQVKIYETTGVIEFVYGTMTTGAAVNWAYACGINNTSVTGPTIAELLTQQTANTATFSSTAQDALAVLPASNSRLTFTPPTPTAAPTGLTFTGVTQIGMTLNWTDNAANEVGYVIYNSTDGVNYSFLTQVAAGAVSAAITGLLPSTTYFWQVYAVTDGRLSTALTGTQATLLAGTVTSIVTGNWNTTTTWDCTCIPTGGDNVIIANGTTVTLDVNGSCNSLAVGQGVSGQLTIGNNATGRTLTVNTGVTVNTGAIMTTGAFAATHAMTMGGNLTNNGTLNLAPVAGQVCNITFNKNGNQTISGTGGTTRFNRITLNMGTSNANVLDVTSTNFTIAPTNFLTLTNGTFKISTATATLTPFAAATTIPLSTGIWLNNAGATIFTGATVTLYGYVRATAGILNVGDAADENLTSYGGTITIDGGTVNVAGRLDRAGPTVLTNFTMSSGTLIVATVGSTTAGAAPFRMDEIGSTFNMSGGTIIIRRPGAGNLGYVNTGGTVGAVTGGTLQIGDASTPAAQTMQINGSVPVYNLTVSNSVAVTAQLSFNSLTAKNNVTINSGALDANSLNITLGGNWTNSGTFTASIGTVTFNGTAAQQIIGASTTTFNNLTIANTSATGVTLFSAPANVSGALTLTSGKVYTDLTNILTMNAGSTATSGNATAFVDGPMNKAGTTTFVFPLGDGTRWARLGIGVPTAGTTFRAQYFATPYTNTTSMAAAPLPVLNNVSTMEYWQLDRTIGAGNATVTLYWEDAGFSGISDCSTTDLRVAHWNGTAWENNNNVVTTTGTCAGATAGTISTSSNVTAFSPFTFGSLSSVVNPLPIGLLFFTGECILLSPNGVGRGVRLKWSTATEMNNNYFTIEQSKDGINWKIVGSIDGAGDSFTTLNYSFTDSESHKGISYYRLKQTDFDGKFEYSAIISVKNCGEYLSELIVYPNPTSGKFSIQASSEFSIEIYNVFGEKIFSAQINSGKTEIDISEQPSGIYFLQIKSENGTVIKKIIIHK